MFTGQAEATCSPVQPDLGLLRGASGAALIDRLSAF